MTRTARRRAVTGLLTATLAIGLTACTTKGNDDVQTKAPDQATSEVKQYAETTRTAIGAGAFTQANENVTPCEGRAGELSDPEDVYYVQGNYQLLVPADQQADTLAKAREQWERDGHTITKERSFGPDGTGEVSASSSDGHTLTLSSGQPPAMLLLVASPCYRR
jgi:hypothetical protein